MIRSLCLTALILGIAGCTTYQSPPASVLAMPNDCANIAAMERWLETQSQVSRAPLQSQNHHEQLRSQFRHRLWTLRYNCRTV
jgi:hypothetical protein